MQSALFPRRSTDPASPCFHGDDPIAGDYMQGQTMHDWCKRHYRGSLLGDGRVIRCDCPCHSERDK